jgi:hypothetical protein
MDISFNIVNLIENNPVTRLSDTYNNKLLGKIKEKFSENEQQLFISSFYCYLKYHPTNDFVIDFDNIWKWLGFTQKVNAKRVLEKNFTIEIDYKISLFKLEERDKEQHGGQNKQNILLNIQTFKLLCIKAETKKADDIHNYFVKLEGLLQETINEECIELKNQLENVKQNFDKKLEQEKTIEKQKLLIRNYGVNHAVVYIVKVKTYENGEYIVKIGESDHLDNRFKEHQKNYEEAILLDCFPVNKNVFFEKFLHGHDKIRPNKVKNLTGHENENELFLVGKNLTYNVILNIVNENIKNFKDWTVNDVIKIMQEENRKLLDRLGNNNASLQNIFSPNNDLLLTLMEKIDNLEKTNKEILEKLNGSNNKTTTNFGEPLVTLGPRLQKINPETMNLLKVYESVTECLNESNNTLRASGLKKAIKENTVYNGYRWMYVDRNKDPNILENVPETKVTRLQNLGYIAKVNIDKTKILNVYLDRKTAASENGYLSSSALDNPVKNGTITNGFIYMLYQNCNDNLRDDLEENIGEIILYKDGIGRFDSQNNLVNEFRSKEDCCLFLKMSDRTLRKALETKQLYNNYYYKGLGCKMKVFRSPEGA